MGVKLIPATVEQYRDLLRQLLPPGRLWRRPVGDAFVQLLTGLAGELVRVHDRLVDLLAEVHPGTADEMIGDWEEALGLPEPDAGTPGTLAERQDVAHAHLLAQGGQTAAYFIELAAAAGHAITIDARYAQPFRVQQNRVGDRLYAAWWVFVWRVNVAGPGPLEQLEALLWRYAPAHTFIEFNYV